VIHPVVRDELVQQRIEQRQIRPRPRREMNGGVLGNRRASRIDDE
jgi:hypothetical protein